MDLAEELGQLDLLTTDGPFTMKEITQIISDLKKDNFNLRLRIFFYEERLQQRCDDSAEEMYKTNIDLKVEVETLKEEFEGAAEDYPEQMEQLREYCNTKIQQLEKTDHSQSDTPTQPEHSQSNAPTQTDPLSKEQEPDQNPEKFQDLLNLLE
ncbi:CDK5 regulatory subunit-associated protein 2-like [Salmo salar]|uniref:CDK5 regulatory subunit-associated protein 2-like n=1 Tax=Salmo salar TaxID=8030 RepID=A0ABM3DG55_SALSA|nr:CDK5 regulatory subunit-associated protein 2-like [Salmo salar]